MGENEKHVEAFGICHKLFYFIMRTLAAQALKPVTLGPPVAREHKSPQYSKERPEDCESEVSIDIEEVVSPLLEDGEGVVKVELVGPKKVVSIKDEPEVIYLSNKRRKTMARTQSSGLQRDRDTELRPLRSILKVGSALASNLACSNVGDTLQADPQR